MKVDELYLDNLYEYIFDDKKFVSYKFLSIKLGVDVNTAKQMLYNFYNSKNTQEKEIHATYYLSGMAPQGWISTIGKSKSKEENGESQDSLFSQPHDLNKDKDAYLVMLCKDRELEEMKKNFSRLYSVHIYGLSSFRLNNLDTLNKAAETPLRDDDGNAAVHFGPITCAAAFEYRENPVLAPLIKNLEEVKVNLQKTKEKIEREKDQLKDKPVERVETPVSPMKGRQGTSTNASKKASDTSSNNGGPNRLKNMFAAAATRPKSKEAVIEKPRDTFKQEQKTSEEKTSEEPQKTSNKGKNKSGSNTQSKNKSKVQESQNRKRKRIRDVFSSSSEDEDKKMSDDDDEDCIPESPIPRNLMIESDSDDDFVEKKQTPVKTAKESEPVAESKTSGKRRVCKTVPRRHVDEEGFLVTVMEQVMVSESDQSDEEKEKAKPDKKDDTREKGRKSVSDTVPSSSNKKKESSRPVSTTSNSSNSSKTKQASIMSFFQKK